ncbi:MAG: T9SS type A sorting domain-containing protein [Bacteroidales bacterium]|nr:T9SS type A sorting domain-containing protein [Bacteroidales bacterium]
MKNFKYLTILALCIISNYILAQISQDWKFQSAGYVIEGYTTDNPDDYAWYEESNISQGVHISVLPSEKRPIFIEQNNNFICFNTFLTPTWGSEFIINVFVNINDNGYYSIYDNNPNPILSVVWFNSSNVFSSLGCYNLKVKIQEAMGTEYFREYEIIVIPSSDKLYKDNYGNSLRMWEGNNPGNNIPVVFSEGFDAYDTNPQQMYYYAASDLITCMRDNGFDIYLLDNIYGTQDIRNNAAGFSAAVRYVSELHSNELIVAGGVSMGGMIARYALAKAENDGNALPVYTFISVDSPQQGAIVSQPLQDYKKEHTEGDGFAEHALNNDAAKQMLNYSTYDPEGSIRNDFYTEMNSLNGDGYPHQTKNIGVSFSTNSPNPNSGVWLTIEWESGGFQGEEASFELTSEEKVAGSYLPVDLTTTAPFIMRKFAWFWNFLIQPWNYPVVTITRTNDPAYISYESALDIVNGESKFDVTIEPDQTTYHDILPSDIINDIINELIFTDIYLQNQTIVSNSEYLGKRIYAGNNVNPNLPSGNFIISSGTVVNFTSADEVTLMDGFSAEEGADFNVIINENLVISCNKSQKKSSDNNNRKTNKSTYKEQNHSLTFIKKEEINRIEKNKNFVNEYLIYPNPVYNKLNIFLPPKVTNLFNIELNDIYGNIMLKQTNLYSNHIVLDLSLFPQGIYFLKIYQENKIVIDKIIKQ